VIRCFRRLIRRPGVTDATVAPPRAVIPDWRAVLKGRMRLAAALGVFWALAIVGRLFYLQIVNYADLMLRAERQQLRTIPAPAKRGDIVDRHGRVVAMSADADSIYAVPSELADPAGTAAQICAALRDCTARDRKTLAERLDGKRAFAFVRRLVEPDQAVRVAALKLKSVGFVKESRRFYPNGDLAAHVLGFIGRENRGLGGIEAAYDRLIGGKDGTILVQVDANQRVFSRTERPPTAGSSLELTIDTYLQHMAERELHAGVIANRAAGGTVIIMNPRTGEILAMANEPTFDPNAYRDSSEIARRNRAVQDLYEPGSTFKVVTASAAIEEHVMPVDAPIDVSSGLIKIGSRVVHDDHHYGTLSFTDVIVKSSNVGAIKIGFKLGTERLSDFVKRFGFGRASSPDFPGENSGIVWNPAKWTDSALASVSMGYQIGVTPLQMVAAVSAIANGGELVEPRIVGAVYRESRRYPVTPKVVRRTISADTAATLTTIMEGVVERGTAKAAQIPGYTVAGKTGTAHKLVDGHYSKSDYNASFVGFIPSRNPAVAIIVVTDSPHAGTYYGGSVSAPIFKRIAEATMRRLAIPPSIDPAPAVLVQREGVAASRAVPALRATQTVAITESRPPDTVPDVVGMSAREAMRTLVQLGVSPRLDGDGIVTSQTPEAGAPFERGAECRLVLSRLPNGRDQNSTTQP
jgi:cell division protein FtsI (penicillin-binding protein 3)